MSAALADDGLMDWDRPLVGGPGSPWPHPDEELLLVCQQLQALQAGWQQRWDLTSDGPEDSTDADREWTRYSMEVWPGTYRTEHVSADLPKRLMSLPATTAEGLRAKAAVVKALEQACGFVGCDRDDLYELTASVLTDVAGDAFVPLGEDHPDWKARSAAGHT